MSLLTAFPSSSYAFLSAAARHVRRRSHTFSASQLQVVTCREDQRQSKPDPKNIAFGRNFTDHMLEIEWSDSGGWSEPRICPVHHLSLHPSAKVLHYAAGLFEGMKAFRGVDGRIRLFRPEMNMKRMNLSATRCCFPNFDGEQLIRCISELIKLDQDFVFGPETQTSLYIRPTMIGTEAALGVTKSNCGLLFVLMSPVGPYFSCKDKHVSLLADPRFVRAWPGGTGDNKIGANYAPTIMVQQEAALKGMQQVLWLFGSDHQVTEAGTMNIFMVVREGEKTQLVTPPLTDGIILPGVNRDSILALAREWPDLDVVERRFTMAEVQERLRDTSLLEMFGSGTACVISPVGSILFQGTELQLPKKGEVGERLLASLSDITYGRVRSDWCRVVC